MYGSLPAQFLVSHVADRDHQIAVVPDLAQVAGPQPGQGRAVTPRGGDGTATAIFNQMSVGAVSDLDLS